jgi:hypothetical protein
MSDREEALQDIAPSSSVTARQVLSDLIRGVLFGSLLIAGTLYPVDELLDPPSWIEALARVTVGETWIGFPLTRDWIFLAVMLSLGWIHRSRSYVQFLVQFICFGYGAHAAIFIVGNYLIPPRFTQGNPHEIVTICLGFCFVLSLLWVGIRTLFESIRGLRGRSL